MISLALAFLSVSRILQYLEKTMALDKWAELTGIALQETLTVQLADETPENLKVFLKFGVEKVQVTGQKIAMNEIVEMKNL